jgi:putative DNA primase/helicase
MKLLNLIHLKPMLKAAKMGFWVTPCMDKESGEISKMKAGCVPLEVAGIGSDGKDRFLIMRWIPHGSSSPVVRAVPLADIGEREGGVHSNLAE